MKFQFVGVFAHPKKSGGEFYTAILLDNLGNAVNVWVSEENAKKLQDMDAMTDVTKYVTLGFKADLQAYQVYLNM